MRIAAAAVVSPPTKYKSQTAAVLDRGGVSTGDSREKTATDDKNSFTQCVCVCLHSYVHGCCCLLLLVSVCPRRPWVFAPAAGHFLEYDSWSHSMSAVILWAADTVHCWWWWGWIQPIDDKFLVRSPSAFYPSVSLPYHLPPAGSAQQLGSPRFYSEYWWFLHFT